jgi:hypothetical protein
VQLKLAPVGIGQLAKRLIGFSGWSHHR